VGLRVTTYELERARRFAQTADIVLAAVNGETRLVLVNSPHNPTGSVMPPAEVARLSGLLAERGIPLIVDEVYHPLYFGARLSSVAKVFNTIVVSDLSKALSLSGLRIGWLIDRDARRREHLINLRSYFTVSGSPITEAIAVHALAHRRVILSRLEEVTRTNLVRLDEFMNAHRSTLGWVRPCGGTVAFPWRLDGRDARPMCEALAREGVLVAPGDCFEAAAHFRVGFGAQASGFQQALEIAARSVP
jgi:aspartate/methionine/tyrosine aminotransferase